MYNSNCYCSQGMIITLLFSFLSILTYSQLETRDYITVNGPFIPAL